MTGADREWFRKTLVLFVLVVLPLCVLTSWLSDSVALNGVVGLFLGIGAVVAASEWEGRS